MGGADVEHGSGAGAPVHLSKSIIGRWRDCRLAYRFERIDRFRPAGSPTAAQVRGSAAHEAVAAVLREGVEPHGHRAAVLVGEIAERHGLSDADVERVCGWVCWAAAQVLGRGGRLRWVEELVAVERTAAFTLWAKFDVVVAGGALAPLEVIDYTFGARRVRSPEELAQSVGARAYRLAAGHAEPDRKVRPVAVTEMHVPSGTAITIVPDDGFVREAWAQMHEVAREIRVARAAGDFAPTPGRHCGWCDYRDRCPVVGSSTDEAPA
jgi:putative RecB family exonuclease